MQVVRDFVGTTFTAFSLALIVALTWWLFETREEPIGAPVRVAAAAKVVIFAGILLSQAYMAAVVWFTIHFGEPVTLTPFVPLAVMSVVMVVVGTAMLAWVYRPARIPLVLWALTIGGIATLVTLFKLYVWPFLL